MKKNYLLTFITCSLFFIISFTTQAQSVNADITQNIEALSIYPNPVSNGKLLKRNNN